MVRVKDRVDTGEAMWSVTGTVAFIYQDLLGQDVAEVALDQGGTVEVPAANLKVVEPAPTPDWVAHFLALADEGTEGIDERGPHGEVATLFVLVDEDRQRWSDLSDAYAVRIWRDGNDVGWDLQA